MGRKKVECKARNISISLPFYQIQFIEAHPTFSLSEFVKIHLEEHINLTEDVEKIEKEAGKAHEKRIE